MNNIPAHYKNRLIIYRYRSLIAILFSAFIAALTILFFPYIQKKEHYAIEPFVYERDAQDIFKIFDDNWYWLMPTPKETYSPHYVPYVFKHRAPGANPSRNNTLDIRVIRDDNHIAGFTAFYKKTNTIGTLLFIAVEKSHRGKGLGEKLTLYAINELIKQGASQITLVTRTDNSAAQTIYKKVGFKEVYRDDEGFVYFSYLVKA